MILKRGLYARCLYHRPAPIRLSVGTVSLNQKGNIPTFIHISDGKLHDVNILDLLIPEPGVFYIMDRGYVDFGRLFTLHRTGRFFVIRAKSKYRRRYSHPGDESGGVRGDWTIALSEIKSVRDYPLPLRRICYHDVQTSKTFNFLTKAGFGSLSRFTSSSLSSRIALTANRISTQFYRF